MGGQEHFYLEGQAALATPGEQGQIHILSSTQHPSEVQHLDRDLARAPQRRRDRRGPPDGRRLRRQGDPGRRLCRRLRAGRGEDRPARPRSAPTATTTWSMTGKRHDFAAGLRRRLRRRGPDRGHQHRPCLALRRHRRPFASRSTTGPCSTPTIAIFCPRSRSSRTGSRPTPSPTPPSAASAGRRG